MEAAELAARIRRGERRALARAITLVESTLAEHRAQAEGLLNELGPFTGGSHRVAFTGPPGAGKSTLVDALGARILESGQGVAVLAVDPASAATHGSLLGDAVRMQRLAASEHVFLRSSSNAATLGGVAPGTREAVLLCEAAGFPWVLIETVGVGQAEHAARELCDTLVVLTLAGAGDEIQGMKRGLLEVADAVLVNKSDGAAEALSLAFAAELGGALHLLRPSQAPHVAAVSAAVGTGVEELRQWLASRGSELRVSGALERLRAEQLGRAFQAALARELLGRVDAEPRAAAERVRLEDLVRRGAMLPTAAARALVGELLGQ